MIFELQPELLVSVFTALLLERKVVLVKDDVSDIAIIMMCLISLLKPFDWQSTIITYLKQDMLDYLDAPVPYLIGISTDIFK